MPVEIAAITQKQLESILSFNEGHFIDLKRKEIGPAKLTRTISAFANADGGELYVGIAERDTLIRPKKLTVIKRFCTVYCMPVYDFFHWDKDKGHTLESSGPLVHVTISLPQALEEFCVANNVQVPVACQRWRAASSFFPCARISRRR